MLLSLYVVFPLLKSTTVTVIVMNGMWIWNDYLLLFLVIGSIPIMILYIAVQKYIVAGVADGAVKM